MKTHEEQMKVLEIDEVVGRKGRITTTVKLYVEYTENQDGIMIKNNSYRKIFVVVKKGGDTTTSTYHADGFVKMEQLMDLHNEAYESNFDAGDESKITFIDKQ